MSGGQLDSRIEFEAGRLKAFAVLVDGVLLVGNELSRLATIPLDTRSWHSYGVNLSGTGLTLFVDGKEVHRSSRRKTSKGQARIRFGICASSGADSESVWRRVRLTSHG